MEDEKQREAQSFFPCPNSSVTHTMQIAKRTVHVQKRTGIALAATRMRELHIE
jgi:hypothetical protein